MSSERALISLKSYIGDAVMTAPLADLVNRNFGHLTIQTSNLVRPVLWSPLAPRGFVPIDRGHAPWTVWRHARVLRREKIDIVFLVNRSFRAALTMRMAGIPRRVGHPNEGRNGLLTDVVPYEENEFEAWSVLDLIRPLGIEPSKVRPQLALTDAERSEGARLAQGAHVAIQPGARFPEKQLPRETTIEVARKLQEAGFKLLFVGGPEEKEDSLKVASALREPVVDLVGKTSIRQTMGALASLRATLGSDTGVLHLAAGVGCPVVQIFGPTPAEKWGHAYGLNRVIRAPEGQMNRVYAPEILSAVQGILQGR